MKLIGRLAVVVLLGSVACGKEDPGNGLGGGAGGGTQGGGAGGGGGGAGGGGKGGNGGNKMGGAGGGNAQGGAGGGNAQGGAGGGTPEGGAGGGTPSASYFPFKEGNTWTYEVSEPNLPATMKTNTVVKMEAVPDGPNKGKAAFLVLTSKQGGKNGAMDKTESWQTVEGSKVVRYREVSYLAGTNTQDLASDWTPFRVRFDDMPDGKALAQGLTWNESYDEVKKDLTTGMSMSSKHMDTYTVSNAGFEATVKDKKFPNCVEIKKTSGAADVGKTYWYCSGIGKVKEIARLMMGPTENLISYKVN